MTGRTGRAFVMLIDDGLSGSLTGDHGDRECTAMPRFA